MLFLYDLDCGEHLETQKAAFETVGFSLESSVLIKSKELSEQRPLSTVLKK